MYFSKVLLTWPQCRNPYEWHRAIWKIFPEKSEDDRDFLFTCLDRRQGRNMPIILLSNEKPRWQISEAVSLLDEPKSLADLSFKVGQMLRFKLTANPTKILTEQNDEKRKIRVPLIKEDQQAAWLKRKLDGIVTIKKVVVQNEAPLYFNRKGKAGKIVPVSFEGILRVDNSEMFINELYQKRDKDGNYCAGIGPAKAFGCGLMLVRRV